MAEDRNPTAPEPSVEASSETLEAAVFRRQFREALLVPADEQGLRQDSLAPQVEAALGDDGYERVSQMLEGGDAARRPV